MSKISSDGLQDLRKNIKNPLENLYKKIQKKGSLKWSDMKEEYNFIYKYLDNLSNWDIDNNESEPTVIVNNKVYKADK